jgi:High potential iron-sulfur protein
MARGFEMGKNNAILHPPRLHMQSKFSRRSIVKSGLLAGVLLPAAGLMSRHAAAASPLPPVDPADPTAKALGFVTDGSKVNTKTYPQFKPTQKCGTCAQFQGKPGDASAACTIFAGKSVPAGGWCSVWAQKG